MSKLFSFFRRVLKKEDGQSVVEFALVLPFLLLIVCGIIELGLLINTKLTLNNCAREAVRYAAINSNEVDIEGTITDRVSQFALLDSINVDVTYSSEAHRQGDVTVDISAVYNSVTPLGKLFFSTNHKLLTSTLTMKVE
jgi:Flp pilus assembly protein TadG